MEAIAWAATIIAILGSIYNSFQKVEGFYLWLISNSLYVYINTQAGIIAQAILFAFNILICLSGLYTWTKNSMQSEARGKESEPYDK